jgi:ComF family protein
MLSESKCPTRSRRPLPLSLFPRQLLEASRMLADSAISVLLAPACAACAQCLVHPTQGPVCAECWDAIPAILPPVCDSCGDPMQSWRVADAERARCGRCIRAGGHVARSRSVGEYEGSLKAIVHALKYDGRRSLAPDLARRLALCGSDIVAGADVAVPVPLHRSKQRSRGFNQADDLARGLPLPLVRALARLRRTPSQTDLPEPERHANVRGAFSIKRGVSVAGAIVVLVDDVSTTGATLDACAQALLEGGAREVRALTVARVVSKRH